MRNDIEIKTFAAAWSDTTRCGDEYYRMMFAWIASGLRNGTAVECRRLANEYDRTLETFMNFTSESPVSCSWVLQMNLAAKYRSILSGDLEYFGNHAVAEPQLLHK